MLNYKRYKANPVLDFPERTWPNKQIEKAPIWCSVDLRDGNQALVEPMNVDEKMELFDLLLKLGFKEIEIGFPAASQIEFDFLRQLVKENKIPSDVKVQVLSQCREELIDRTFEAIQGIPNVIFHIYNSTSTLQRDVVFNADKDEIIERYREWEFFLETDDELYNNFWSTFDGTTEYDSADEFLGVPAYRRRVIDPSQESGHRRYLKKQEDGSWFIRDGQGMVTHVELKTGERCNRRVCPYCHNPLPANYGKSNQKFVSLIGITNAGKTVYLSQLLYRLKTYAALAGLSAVVNASST